MRSAQAIFPARTKGKTYAMWNTVNISWLEWSLSAACCGFYCKGQADWMCRPQVANISLGPASWRSSADRSSAGASRQLSTSLTGQVQVHQGNSSQHCTYCIYCICTNIWLYMYVHCIYIVCMYYILCVLCMSYTIIYSTYCKIMFMYVSALNYMYIYCWDTILLMLMVSFAV